jgi:type I restriction enzyme R subunit
VVVVDFTNNAKAILEAFAKYRKGTPFEPEEPDPELCTEAARRDSRRGRVHAGDARDWSQAGRSGTDAQVQFAVNALRMRFQARLADPEERKAFVYLLAGS